MAIFSMGVPMPRSGLKCSFCHEGVNPEDAGVKDRKRVICGKCIQALNDMSLCIFAAPAETNLPRGVNVAREEARDRSPLSMHVTDNSCLHR
jgi:hypothetical protein